MNLGEKQNKESRLKDQTASEVQGQFYDTVRQLDWSQGNVSLSPDGEAGHMETRTYSSAFDQLDAKPCEYGDAQAHTKMEGLASPENNLPLRSQTGRKENDPAPLDSAESELVPSLAEEVDHKAAESDTHKINLGLTKETSLTDIEEGNIVTGNNEGSSSYLAGHTEYESDKEHSHDRLKDHDTGVVTYSSHIESDLQGGSRVLSSVTQEESGYETEAIALEAQVSQLEQDMVRPAGSVSLDCQLTGEVPSGEGSAEKTLHVSIPEIIVSSPVPTDDESSDAGSTSEGDANDMQRGVEDSEMEGQQSIDDKQSGTDSSQEVPSSCQENKGDTCDTATYTNQTKENTCPQKEGGISRKHHENKLWPFRSTADLSVSKEASIDEKPGKETAVTDQSERTVSSENVHVPNLGERASSLLSQLRSEIAIMKTARLSNASPVQVTDATEMSQQRDTSQPAPQERDSSQQGPAVTYRLPLFEDVDSACSSFSLDDFLSDPATEEALNSATETNRAHEGAGDY